MKRYKAIGSARVAFSVTVGAEDEDDAGYQAEEYVYDGDFNIDDIYDIEVDGVEEIPDAV